MNATLTRTLLSLATLSTVALVSLPSHAQDVRREDMVNFFQMDKIDKDKDGMVSKKEFVDMMGKAWETQMAAQPKARDKMTLEQYKAFAKMFSLDIGS